MTFVVALISCDRGFEEMNVAPFSPTGTTTEALFAGLTSSLQQPSSEMFYLSNEIFYPESELGALTSDAWGNSFIGTSATWNNYYFSLANIRDIENRLDTYCLESQDDEIADKVRAKLIVIKSFMTFKVTDIFGDVPYSQAGRIWEGSSSEQNMKPGWDSQESIYKALLAELEWARNILRDNPAQTANGNEYYEMAYEVLFNNNNTYWAEFANSLILRHALRMYDRDPEFSTPLLVEAYDFTYTLISASGGVATGGGICLWPSLLATSWDINWSFREHKNLRMGETIWHCLSSNDSLDGSGIYDYRAFLFFDTNHKTDDYPDGSWRAYPQIRNEQTPTEGGSPYALNRDSNYTFKGPACIYSPFNFYLTRDERFVPQILVNYADVLFMKAEIGARGIGGIQLNSMELDLMVNQGIYQSCLFWTQMAVNTPRWTYKYPQYLDYIGSLSIWDYCNNMAANVMNYEVYLNGDFDYSSDAYLKLIIKQRWLNLFRQPWEAWALARRTWNTPTTTNYAKLASFRMEYPQGEIEYNYENYTTQLQNMTFGDSRKTPMWWMTQTSPSGKQY